jgi:hypothetical protein
MVHFGNQAWEGSEGLWQDLVFTAQPDEIVTNGVALVAGGLACSGKAEAEAADSTGGGKGCQRDHSAEPTFARTSTHSAYTCSGG